jgi:hypothetical protein
VQWPLVILAVAGAIILALVSISFILISLAPAE